MNIKAFSLNEIGGRKNVEDAIMPQKFAPQDAKIFVVCDGVGGSSFGEVASDIASKTFYETFKKETLAQDADFERLLHASLKQFQKKVADYIETNAGAAGTSTTLTLIVLQNNKAYIAWCGDSKIYQLRNGKPVYKSSDHSLVAELVAQGVITEAEAETHPQRNIITRSLNANTKPTDIDFKILTDIQNDDWFLLCTDGLMEQFTENLFAVVLNKYDAATNYSEVIEKICYGKTKDNYSMYLLHVEKVAAAASSKKIIVPILVVLLLAVGGWFAWSQLSKPKPVVEEVPVKKVDSLPSKDTVQSIMMKRPEEPKKDSAK